MKVKQLEWDREEWDPEPLMNRFSYTAKTGVQSFYSVWYSHPGSADYDGDDAEYLRQVDEAIRVHGEVGTGHYWGVTIEGSDLIEDESTIASGLSLDRAKAAAQADFERRVMACMAKCSTNKVDGHG